MSFVVRFRGGPYESEDGSFFNDATVMDEDGSYHEEEIYYDSYDEAMENWNLIELGPIDLEYEWYDGEDS